MPEELDIVEGNVSFWVGNDHICVPVSSLAQNPDLKRRIEFLYRDSKRCPFKYFAPHGTAKHAEDIGMDLPSMLEWLNDWGHDLYINRSPAQSGKTAHGVLKSILGLFPSDPNWPIYKQNGVRYVPFTTPMTLAVFTYDKSKLRDNLWPELQKWIPPEELGEYASDGKKELPFRELPRLKLKCKSRILFFSYEQSPAVVTGIKCKRALVDEQPLRSFIDELIERGRTLGGIQIICSMTPHKIDGMAETGGENVITKVWEGTETLGLKILRTRISVDDVPDHIESPDEKKKAYQKWIIEPQKTGDEFARREGLARYYGYTHMAADRFYHEFDRKIHVIDISAEEISRLPATHYRAIDHGTTNPCAALKLAMIPGNIGIIYDEFYKRGGNASTNGADIIEWSGNSRELIGQASNPNTSMAIDEWAEKQSGHQFFRTFLDRHCFTQNDVGWPISLLYKFAGLTTVEPWTTANIEARSQFLRALLRLDPYRKHYCTGKEPAPMWYISNRCPILIKEIEGAFRVTRPHSEGKHNQSETRNDKDDHLLDCLEGLAAADPFYIPLDNDFTNNRPRRPQTTHRGY